MVVHGVDIDSLSEKQRHELISALQENLQIPERVVEAQRKELEARLEAYRAGELETEPFDEVLRSL